MQRILSHPLALRGVLVRLPPPPKEKKKPTANAVDLSFGRGRRILNPSVRKTSAALLCYLGARLRQNCRKRQFVRGSSSPSAHKQNKKGRRMATFLFWQGQKDSNPRPLVLETSTLPAELYPCATRGIITHFFSFCKPFFEKIIRGNACASIKQLYLGCTIGAKR